MLNAFAIKRLQLYDERVHHKQTHEYNRMINAFNITLYHYELYGGRLRHKIVDLFFNGDEMCSS